MSEFERDNKPAMIQHLDERSHEPKVTFRFDLPAGGFYAKWRNWAPIVILYSCDGQEVDRYSFNHIPVRADVQSEILHRWTDEIVIVWQEVPS